MTSFFVAYKHAGRDTPRPDSSIFPTIPAHGARSLTMQSAERWKLVLYILNVDFGSDRLGGVGHM